jgi:CRP-like cAMP-binding protein
MTFSQSFLKELISNITPITNQEFKKIKSIFSERLLKKGAKAIDLGESSDLVLIVTKGLLREFTVINQEEHTLWITGVGEVILDPGSFMLGEPSKIAVEALVNSHIIFTKRQQVEDLLKEMPHLNEFTHVVYQKNLQDFREHMLLLKIWPTQKREEILFEKKPHLLRKEVKLKHIASLLNVHPNSLSRIRNQKAE